MIQQEEQYLSLPQNWVSVDKQIWCDSTKALTLQVITGSAISGLRVVSGDKGWCG